ncbi:hypothetical protein AB0C12_43555 [Actinoplanes sp. NPDC048967]|uniref:hypothetical protein n=1 Tax=Actinoplanes sp. NPDC048967 TaxID=3155269 RepID=UPI0033DF7944
MATMPSACTVMKYRRAQPAGRPDVPGGTHVVRQLDGPGGQPGSGVVTRPFRSEGDQAKATGRRRPGEGDRAKADRAKADRAKTDQAKTDRAKTDRAKTDQAKTDQAKTDRAKTDRAKTDQAKTDRTGGD